MCMMCDCGNSFTDEMSYLDHTKYCVTKRDDKKFPSKENYKCQEKNCSFSCSSRLDFLNHLKNSHSIDSCWEEKTFKTYEGKILIMKKNAMLKWVFISNAGEEL